MVQFVVDISGNGTLTTFDCDPSNLSPLCQQLLDYFGTVSYVPTLAGNALYLTVFVIVLLVQITQGIIYHTWSYMLCIILGLVLEAIGYGSRIGMHINPWDSNPFLIQIITVTIAPIFFSACIYLCLSRLIPLYDPSTTYAHFRPRTYTIIFLSADFLCLVLQAVGGALADTAATVAEGWNGVHIMIAGLALQVGSLLTFSVLCAHFTWRLRSTGLRNPEGWEGRTRKGLEVFILSLCTTTFLILIRSCFRVAELNNGFRGKLANEEISFMILEGAMIILATLCLTLFHPGRYLGDQWRVKTASRTKEGARSYIRKRKVGVTV